MTIKNVLNQMARMVAGECRWIGNEGIHVYAFGSHVDGKYNPRSLVYRVVTGRRPYDSQPWLDSLTAANIVISEAAS